MTPTKDEAASTIARSHIAHEPSIVSVMRIRAAADIEADLNEPVKLLEVNEMAVPSGIVPIEFGAHAASGVPYRSVVVELSPEEFESLEAGEIALPNAWQLAEQIPIAVGANAQTGSSASVAER